MHKLIVRQGDIEQVHEFESSELAQLYRDYHLAFGHWNGISRWVEEKDLTPEKQRFVIDEKTELKNGQIVRFFKLTDGIELRIEEASPSCIADLWRLFREKRDIALHKTDWTQLADCELSMEEKKDYRSYRSYLKTLPRLYDDASIVSAKIYSFGEWKKGMR
jgi:hypothetical protein